MPFERYIHIFNDITLHKAHTILLPWVTWSNENNIQSLIRKPSPYGSVFCAFSYTNSPQYYVFALHAGLCIDWRFPIDFSISWRYLFKYLEGCYRIADLYYHW